MKESFANLSLGTTRYIEAGTGEVLLLLHGMAMANSANTFDSILPSLSAQFRTVAVDLLGFGKGVRQIVEGPTFELILGHLREFMDALGIESAHVVGHSFGGWIAARLAYESRDRVRRLVLLNAAGLNAEPSSSVVAISAVPSLDALIAQGRKHFINPTRADEEFLVKQASIQLEILQAPDALQSLDTLMHMMHSADLRCRYMLHRCLPYIKAPTLVLWGTRDSMDPYPTWTKEYAALDGEIGRSSKPWVIPGAKYVLVDSGHYTHWENPELTVRLLTGFLT